MEYKGYLQLKDSGKTYQIADLINPRTGGTPVGDPHSTHYDPNDWSNNSVIDFTTQPNTYARGRANNIAEGSSVSGQVSPGAYVPPAGTITSDSPQQSGADRCNRCGPSQARRQFEA